MKSRTTVTNETYELKIQEIELSENVVRGHGTLIRKLTLFKGGKYVCHVKITPELVELASKKLIQISDEEAAVILKRR